MDLRPLLALVASIVALWAALLLLFWARRPRGVPAPEILKVVPDVLRLVKALLGDNLTPLDVRLVLVGLLAWILSPVDLIPEFIPVLGPLDDVIVAIIAMRYIRRRMGVEALWAKWPGSASRFTLLLRVIGSGP